MVKGAAKNSKENKVSSIDFLSNLGNADLPVTEMPLEWIKPDPQQPRQTWHSDDGLVPDSERSALENLAEDIKAQGVIQPIVVRETGENEYTICVGERRWRASKLAGLSTIPAIIRQDLSGLKLSLAQVAENVQRENMSDLDTAKFVQRLLTDYPELQKRDLAKLLNKHPSYVSRMMSFIDPRWEHIVDAGIITYASVLEQFRSLSEPTQTRLIKLAKESGNAISAADVQSAKKSENLESAKTPSRGALDGIGQSFENILQEEQDKGDTYVRKPDAIISSDTPSQVIDHGSEIVNNLPTTPSDLSNIEELSKVQEVKITLGQLTKLLSVLELDGAVAITVPLSTEYMREAIGKLGGTLPEESTWLNMALIESLK